MKLADIHKVEHSRQKPQMNEMHFYDSGAGWWRAYEWSGWLAHFYPNGLAPEKRLTPSHRPLKEDANGIISVALQLEQMAKFLPGVEPEMVAEGHVVVHVDGEQFKELATKPADELLQQWKSAVPVKQKEKPQKQSTVYARPSSFTAIMKRIIGYQLEQRTTEDNILFIRELKQMCADLI